MSRKTFIITEGKSDQVLFEALLDTIMPNASFRIEAAGGWSSADSLARSILMRGTEDVILIVDADALDSNSVEERKRFLHNSLAQIVSPCKRQVIVIAPEIDVLLFQDRHILETVVGHQVDNSDFIRGRFEPTQVLKELLRNKSRAEVFKQKLFTLDLKPILEHPDVQLFLKFLMMNQQRAAA